MSLAWSAYRVMAPALGALAPAASWLASPHERRLWRERMGNVHTAGGVHAWVHGASLGEATAVVPLVAELERLQPGARFWLTATTRSGRARLAASGRSVSLAPIDAPQAVRRFFDGVRPERLWIVETELWPHWLMRARAEGVPVAIVSARLSERSRRRYRRLGAPLRRLVAGLDGVLCQSGEDAERWRDLGARSERTVVVGNLKIDALAVPASPRPAARLALGFDPDRPLLVLGSVRPGEITELARAWQRLPEPLRRAWQVAILPRHARAVADLRDEAERARQPLATAAAPRPGAWRLEERSGVLMDYYAAADVAFVGGSLRPYGGHNPIEPLACGAATVIGPHHASQRAVVRALEAARGIQVAEPGDPFAEALGRLLADAALRASQVAAGRKALDELRGAARRAVAHLAAWKLWPAS